MQKLKYTLTAKQRYKRYRALKNPNTHCNNSSNERGIYLADAIASGNYGQQVEATFRNSENHIVSDFSILQYLSSQLQHPYVSDKEGVIYLDSVQHRAQQQAYDNYLKRRDEYKFLAHLSLPSISPTWEGVSVSIAAKLFAKAGQGMKYAQIQRILYDWHYHGRNQFKATADQQQLRCNLCGNKQEDQCHIIHYCSDHK